MSSPTWSSPTLELPDDFDEFAWEVHAKGWFDGVVVDGERRIAIAFYDPRRLLQEIEHAVATEGQFAEVNLVVVSEVSSDSMRRAVSNLVASGRLNMFAVESGSG